jgi:hypothetical protein
MVANGHATQPSDLDRVSTALRETRATADSKWLDLKATEDRAVRLAGDFKLAAIRQYADPTIGERAGEALDELERALSAQAEYQSQVRAAKQDVEDAKALAILNAVIDGKNDDVRKKQQAEALRNDAEYQDALRRLVGAEGREVNAEVRVKVAQAQLDLLKAFIRQSTAVLEFLAS